MTKKLQPVDKVYRKKIETKNKIDTEVRYEIFSNILL